MTLLNYLIIALVSFISGGVMYYLGMRHGAKKLAKMFIEDSEKLRMERRLNRGARVDYSSLSKSRLRSRSTDSQIEECVIYDRDDATHVLATLVEFADKHQTVSVADYYDLIKVTSNFTDNNYGWRYDAVKNAEIVPVSHGYVIKFPPVEVL